MFHYHSSAFPEVKEKVKASKFESTFDGVSWREREKNFLNLQFLELQYFRSARTRLPLRLLGFEKNLELEVHF